MSVYTDLALEAKEMAERGNQQLPGVESQEDVQSDIHIHMVRVTSAEGSNALGKPPGQYITLESDQFRDIAPDTKKAGAKAIADQLKRIRPVDKNEAVLVVGLGNPAITADSLGPKLTQHILVTRHIKMLYPDLDQRLSNVSALVPGVLGITGIETGDIIKGVADRMKPALIIVIDALAASETRRIATTVQIADTGIQPGSGVGNHRMELTKQALGIDIIAIGVPTVVYARTVARDAMMGISELYKGDNKPNKGAKFPFLGDVNPQDADELLDEALDQDMKSLVVAPKDIDQLIDKMSEMVADGLNQYLHYDCPPDVIEAYM